MTTAELLALVGRRGEFDVHGRDGSVITFKVSIVDARRAYGRVDVQLAPVAGRGSLWVAVESIRFENGE